MDPKNIVVLGVKNTVIAFRRDTGERLWATRLKSSMASDFVSVAVDDTRVYAHTGGEVFCLDLANGNGLWSDGLSGFGYGVASIALPGAPVTPVPAVERKRQQDANASATNSPPPS